MGYFGLGDGFCDFLKANMSIVDITCNFSAPAIVGIMLGRADLDVHETIPTTSGWLCIA